MSKKGTYNAAFFNDFAARVHGSPVRFGLLIGTTAGLADEKGTGHDVVFAAPTPPMPQPPPEAGAAKQPPRAPPRDVAALLRSRIGVTSFSDWALEHAAQVARLLPGGLGPCGVFAVAAEAGAKDLAPLLVQLLKGVADPLVLIMDSTTRKLSFWQHVGGAKPTLRQAQVRADVHKDALMLWSAISVDIVVPQRCTSDNDDLKAAALARSVEKCLATELDQCSVGLFEHGGGPFKLADLDSEEEVGAVVAKDCKELKCAFLHASGSTLLAAAPNPPEGRPLLRQRCLVVATAFLLRRNMEFRHAVKLLQRALSASAGERLRLALEDFGEAVASDGAGRAKVGKMGRLHLPWRALLSREDLDLPLLCGDYCMPDEDPKAARERASELLGLPEEALQEAPEHLCERALLERDFTGSYAPEPAAAAATASGQRPAEPGEKARPAVPAAACVAAAVALAAALAVPVLLRLL